MSQDIIIISSSKESIMRTKNNKLTASTITTFHSNFHPPHPTKIAALKQPSICHLYDLYYQLRLKTNYQENQVWDKSTGPTKFTILTIASEGHACNKRSIQSVFRDKHNVIKPRSKSSYSKAE